MDPLLLIILIFMPLLLIASAFFSGSETALFSLTQHERVSLARSKQLTATTLTQLLKETRSLLITLLMGNMTINVLYFVLSSVILIRLAQREAAGWLIGVAAVLPLIVIILMGEILPKLVASRLTLQFARLVALPLFVVHRVLEPIRFVAQHFVITPLARLVAPKQKPAKLSAEELETLIQLSQHQGVINFDEERLLQQVLELSQLRVTELMTPRVDMVAHDLDDGPEALINMIRATRHRQIPVFEEDLDTILGIVYARQVLLKRPKTIDQARDLVRQIRYVPERQHVDKLLVEFRRSGDTVAIVVDEYGGTQGIVTLRDVVNHMIGGLPEDDSEAPIVEPDVEQIGEGCWRVSADLPIHEWADQLGERMMLIDEARLKAVSTIGGLIMSRLGRVPVVGDRIRIVNLDITVEAMEQHRVDTVRVELVTDLATDSMTDSTTDSATQTAKGDQ